MKILLLKDVKKVGRKGEIINVAPGLANNMLLPNGMAKIASDSIIKDIEKKNTEKGELDKRHTTEIVDFLHKIDGKTIKLDGNASDSGKLYRAIHVSDIIQKIEEEYKIKLDEKNFLEHGPWKISGKHEINLVFERVKAKIVLEIV